MTTLNVTNLKNPSSASNNIVLDAAGGAAFQQIKGGALTLGTAVNSTSGTSIDFTGIPSWVKRVTVMFNGVSTSGTSNYRIQLGTGGSPTTSGYTGSSSWTSASSVTSAIASGFDINANASATTAFAGLIAFTNISGNIWVGSGSFAYTAGTASTQSVSGVVTLSSVLNMLRITTVNGTDTFDAGSINIMYEG